MESILSFDLAIVANICSILSLVAVVASYLLENKTQYLVAQVVANCLYGLQYTCLGGWSGVASSILAATRTVTFYIIDRRNKKPSVFLLIFFEVIILAFGILTYKDITSLIPVITGCLFTWASWQPSYKIICISGIIAGILWCIYNYYIGAYISIIASILEFCASLAGLIKQCQKREEL